ncbi:MAG: amidase [Alphaproteobacteria bacterium]|nr:amidase [Alphaproteobacteria bacterium]
MSDPTDLTVAQATAALTFGQVTATDLTRAYLARIERLDKAINSYVRVLAERALAEAGAADARIAKGQRRGVLDGIPYAVKDNMDTQGDVTSDGLAPRGKPAATADAEAVRRLAEAGAVLLGKLNLHEGALGATTDNAHFGRCHNPWRAGFTPGGSSGGSGAAVAAGLAPFALGTDTMGSIRIPAAYCGCVGLKASYGLVSNLGVTPACDALDHVGPLARTVNDAALVLRVLQAPDPEWPGSAEPPANWSPLPADLPDLSGIRLGVAGVVERFQMESSVRLGFSAAVGMLRRLGASVATIEIPGYEPTSARRAGLLWVEAAAAHAHEPFLDRYPDAYPAHIRAMLDYGRTASAARLARAQDMVQRTGAGYVRALEAVDALVMPVAPQPAFSFDEPVPATQAEFAAPANFAGLPAVALPSGVLADGLPLSLQFVGRKFAEARLLAIARVFERVVAFDRRPPL